MPQTRERSRSASPRSIAYRVGNSGKHVLIRTPYLRTVGGGNAEPPRGIRRSRRLRLSAQEKVLPRKRSEYDNGGRGEEVCNDGAHVHTLLSARMELVLHRAAGRERHGPHA